MVIKGYLLIIIRSYRASLLVVQRCANRCATIVELKWTRPDLLSDGCKSRILAAGGCTLTTAEPPQLKRAVVITQ